MLGHRLADLLQGRQARLRIAYLISSRAPEQGGMR